MAKPSLCLVRQNRLGAPRYIADTLDNPEAVDSAERFTWTPDRSSALTMSRSTARRLAAIASIEGGRSAMVFPATDE